MTGICPCCGYNLTPDEPVSIGKWRIVPREGVYFSGRRVVTRQTWTQILLALAREQGRRLSTPALLARVSESERDNTLASQISQLRRHLKKQNAPDPITANRGREAGYCWELAA